MTDNDGSVMSSFQLNVQHINQLNFIFTVFCYFAFYLLFLNTSFVFNFLLNNW